MVIGKVHEGIFPILIKYQDTARGIFPILVELIFFYVPLGTSYILAVDFSLMDYPYLFQPL